jgi:hypothetical protein
LERARYCCLLTTQRLAAVKLGGGVDEDLLTERDVISGGLVDIRKAIDL